MRNEKFCEVTRMDLKIDNNSSDVLQKEDEIILPFLYCISIHLQYDFQEVINFSDNWLGGELPNRAVLININN